VGSLKVASKDMILWLKTQSYFKSIFLLESSLRIQGSQSLSPNKTSSSQRPRQPCQELTVSTFLLFWPFVAFRKSTNHWHHIRVDASDCNRAFHNVTDGCVICHLPTG
jgi:hypothetical protein